jgi:hypothetical protein
LDRAAGAGALANRRHPIAVVPHILGHFAGGGLRAAGAVAFFVVRVDRRLAGLTLRPAFVYR